MSNEVVMVPQEIPQYAISVDQARAANADALSGVFTGAPPSIVLKGTMFQVKDGNGESQVIKAADLAENEFLNVVILAAKPQFNKAYYAEAFDPNQTEANAPDCWSDDAVRPHHSIAKPMSATCAGCPMNAFGSGRNQAGQPTEGKACSDMKILAALYRGKVYKFKIPPGSLKNWGRYVKTLTDRGVCIGNVVTYIGFDENAKFATLVFRVGSFVPENALPRLVEIAGSQEVADITKPTSYVALPPPAPEAHEEKKVATETDLFGSAPAPAKPEPATSTDETPRRGRQKKDASEGTPAAALTDDQVISVLGL